MSGEVIGVADGKTVRIKTQSGEIKVELQFIEVPEPGQDLHQRVKDHLSGLVKGKVVTYRPVRLLQDRSIGRVAVNDVDVSLQMIRDGAAWHVTSKSAGQDAAEYELYRSMEAAAKTEKRGIWSVAGLKPAWEVRAERSAETQRIEDARYPRSIAVSKPRPGQWGDINPAIGDVGALINGYNAATRIGYVGTSLLDLTSVDPALGVRMAVDVTYHYKETAEGRKGIYLLTVVSRSKNEYFSKDSKLLLVGDEKIKELGLPKRTVTPEDGAVREVLTFQLSREVLESVANQDVVLKVGNHLIYPSGIKYLIMNMLQAT
jgi:endonuclease YncB( thermonuclease family)